MERNPHNFLSLLVFLRSLLNVQRVPCHISDVQEEEKYIGDNKWNKKDDERIVREKKRALREWWHAKWKKLYAKLQVTDRENYTLSPLTITPFSLHLLNFKK